MPAIFFASIIPPTYARAGWRMAPARRRIIRRELG
jgi:hypothetical protein